MAQTTETPAETLQAATEENVLPAGGLALLGTFLKPEAATALIRTPTGDTRTVTIGDKIGRYTVAAIETGALHIAQADGRARKLTLPGAG